MQTLSISEAADLLSISTKTLKRWENSGLVSPDRNRLNHRRYELSRLLNLKQSRTASEPSLLSLKSIALQCGVSPRTIRRWQDQGLISIEYNPQGKRAYSNHTLQSVKKLVQTRNQTSTATIKKIRHAYPAFASACLLISLIPTVSLLLRPKLNSSDLVLKSNQIALYKPVISPKTSAPNNLPATVQHLNKKPRINDSLPLPTPTQDLLLTKQQLHLY